MQSSEATINSQSAARRSWFRKAYLLPAEHGSWSWLLVPYIVGASLAIEWSLASFFVLVGGLSTFLLRQPASAWLRIKQGRGRRSDEKLTLAWTGVFSLLALISLAGLIAMQRTALLWLLPPVLTLFVIYIAVAQVRRAQIRNLWMELAGASGLAVMAPAAYVAGNGELDRLGWLLWLMMALQNGLGVLYVRRRIADTHGRTQPRLLVLTGHAVGLALLATVFAATGTPWIALAPFILFAGRAAWLALRERPIDNIKRFGFTEVGVELLAGLWVVFALHLP